jgi:hypothetical protein
MFWSTFPLDNVRSVTDQADVTNRTRVLHAPGRDGRGSDDKAARAEA